MNGKVVVGVISGALLLSGLLVGVSYGEPAGTDEPTVLELYWRTGHDDSQIEIFFIEHCDESVPVCGQISLKDMPLFDQDGNEVGRQHISCTASDTTAWVCSLISQLKDGPYTDKGTVVATGVSKHRPGKPNISSIPVTGGTGAYNNVGGHVIQEGVDGTVKYTLFLEPA